jgi:transcriptional adapter 3
MTAFWSSMEAYIRDIREDDLAMLNFKADAPESFDIPARGRHYTEIWDDEDGNPPGTTPRVAVPALRQPHGGVSVPHFVPAAEMKDELLVEENRGLGNLTERVVAAVVLGQPEDEATKTGDPSIYEGNRDVMRVDVLDLEERMKKELRGVMLLGEHEEVC